MKLRPGKPYTATFTTVFSLTGPEGFGRLLRFAVVKRSEVFIQSGKASLLFFVASDSGLDAAAAEVEWPIEDTKKVGVRLTTSHV